MSYAALITREYGEGRVCVYTDRIGGYRTGHSDNLLEFWRKLLEWVAKKNYTETIKIGVIESLATGYEKRLSQVENVTFESISLQDLVRKNIMEFDLLYFVSLPDDISNGARNKIAHYVEDGYGLFIESPNRGGEYINVLTYIDNVYCESMQKPLYRKAYWTQTGITKYFYNPDAVFYFMTSIAEEDVPTTWEISISDVLVDFETNQTEEILTAEIATAGSVESEINFSYITTMQKGLVEIDEIVSTESSESSTSSITSSSTSTYEPFSWDICDELLAHWKMNENYLTSFVWDSTGNYSNLGTLYNGSTAIATTSKHVTGKINGALSLNGTSNYIKVNKNTLFNFTNTFYDTQFSLSLWIKPNDTLNLQDILEKSYVWNLQLFNEQLWLTFYNGFDYRQFITGSAVTDNSWRHLVFAFDGTDLTIYNNCTSISFTDTSVGYTTMANDNDYFFIGKDISDTFFYNGAIDSVMIVDRCLTELEVQSLWNMGNGTENCHGIFGFTSSSDTTSSASTSSTSTSSSST